MKSAPLRLRIFLFAPLLAASALLVGPVTSLADTVKLNNGQSLEGRITYEGSDFIKLEIAVSATIKDTKVIPKTDIAEIIKAAPDDVALSELRKTLPAPSLMSAEGYRSLIDNGPKKFLTQFPGSKHTEEVRKILAELETELDQVERGGLKIDGEWVNAKDRQQFKALTESRIRGVSFKRKVAQRDLLGALRDFEVLEERYLGAPAHVEAIETTKQLLPAFGDELTRMLRDVEYRNKKWEEDKGLLDEVERARVENARAQEIANYDRAVAQEKAAGIKWLSINQNSDQSLGGTISLVRAEIERLGAIDIAALRSMSERLVEADKMIAENKLDDARTAIAEANALFSGKDLDPKAKSKPRKPSSSSKKGSTDKEPPVPTSYTEALNYKIAETEEAIKLAKEQEAIAAKGDAVSGVISASDAPVDAVAGDAADAGDASAADGGSALADLMGSTKKTEEKEEDTKKKPTSTKKSSSAKSSAADDDEDGEEKPSRPAVVADEGGGISFQMIMIGVAVLMAVAIGVMKLLGIGGKKEES